jgi:hypothetical protein
VQAIGSKYRISEVPNSELRHLARKDVTGKPIKVGDVVRVIGVPDLSGMSSSGRAESEPVFSHLVGTYKRVREFDEYGYAWLMFRIRSGQHAGLHSVGIEPQLLRIRVARS